MKSLIHYQNSFFLIDFKKFYNFSNLRMFNKKKKIYITANDEGRFNEEIAPVQVKIKKQDTIINVDEHPRPQTTIESLTKLKPVFQKDGLVTAGSASVYCIFF